MFAAGATLPILGKTDEELLGTSLREYVAPRDKLLVEQLLAVAAKKGRIDNAKVRLKGAKGPTPPLSFAGYLMPDLEDHYFLAMRTAADVSEDGEIDPSVTRDQNTGLRGGESFSNMAADKLKEAKAGGAAAELTLINVPGFEEFYNSLDDDDQDILMSTVGTTLRANSIGGDSAGEIGDGKFGIVHDTDVNVDDLEAQLTEATRVFDTQGKGGEVQAGKVDIDLQEVDEEDLTKGLVYTINHLR